MVIYANVHLQRLSLSEQREGVGEFVKRHGVADQWCDVDHVVGKPGDGTLQIWSDSGQLHLLLGEKNDKLTVDIPSDAKAGTHWVRFYNEHGATEQIPFVVGLVPELVAAEPNDTPEQAQVISETAVTVNAVLEKADDVDVFSVSLKAGKTFIAAVQANRELASPMDATLQLLDERGSHFHRGFLLASAYLLEDGGITLYAAFGDWFAVTGLVVAILWGLFGFINGRCRKSRDPA